METKIYVSIFALVSMSLCLNVKGLNMSLPLLNQASLKPISTDVPNKDSSSTTRYIIGTVEVMDPTMTNTPPSHRETPAPLATSVRVSTQFVPEKNSTPGNVTEKTPQTFSINQIDTSTAPPGLATPQTHVSPSTLSSHVSNPSTHHPKLTTTNTKTTTTSLAKSSSLRPETIQTTSSTTQPSSTHSTNLENSTPTQPLSPKSTTTTSTTPSAVPQSVPQPRTSSTTQPPLATTLASSPPAQAKTHTDAPSQLNVVDGQPVFHSGTPALDPLLAGLVSAFIVTAALITLLLFIKMRRQNQRPEFRRLQDLPMDDMMEDTPLSMYSY